MTIALSCPACDKALKVKDELAGKKIKCPGCGEPILVEPDEVPEAAEEEAPRRKPRAEEEEDRPRKKKKKKKKSNATLWLVLAGGVALLLLLLAVGGGLLYFLNQPSEKKSTEQAKTKKKEEPPKLDIPQPQNDRPKGGLARGMDVQTVKNNLKQIGLAYHNCISSNRKAPAKWQDLMQFMEPGIIQTMLTDGSIVFIYNVGIADMTEGSSNTILAYEKDADTKGLRVVLFGDGSVDMLPDGEFQARPKAQPRK
jgi:hypothetical protein